MDPLTQLRLTRELIDIDSTTGREAEAGKWIASTLRRLGYAGSDADVLAKAHRDDPVLLAAVCSSSSMWAANAATVESKTRQLRLERHQISVSGAARP